MARKETSDHQYSEEEAERRLVAALRGSRITGHKPMKDKPKKKSVSKKSPSLKPSGKR
jgi:hypothetical protein